MCTLFGDTDEGGKQILWKTPKVLKTTGRQLLSCSGVLCANHILWLDGRRSPLTDLPCWSLYNIFRGAYLIVEVIYYICGPIV